MANAWQQILKFFNLDFRRIGWDDDMKKAERIEWAKIQAENKGRKARNG